MTYRPGEADMGSLVIRALLFVFVLGVFVGGMAATIFVVGKILGPVGIHW